MRKISKKIKHHITCIFVLLFASGLLNGQVRNSEIQNALASNIKKLYSSYYGMDVSDIYYCKAVFERLLVNIENENRYLIHYYIALADYYISGLIYDDNTKKEQVIDDGIDNISECLKNKPKYIEGMVLQASLYGVKINLRPMRGMDLGMKYQKLISEAKNISPSNPRVYLVSGISSFFSPQQYGGGLDKARGDFNKAIECYKKQSLPVSFLEPAWGEEECYFWMGQISHKEGNAVEAKKYYETSLEINPGYSRISEQVLPNLLNEINRKPEIVPGGEEFLVNDSILVRLSHRFDKRYKIKYRIREDEYGEGKWMTYTNGFYIKNACSIMAKVEYNTNLNSHVAEVNFKTCSEKDFNLSLNLNKQLKKGVSYKLYKGEWDKLPDFRNEKIIKTGVIQELILPKDAPADFFGMTCNGYINVPQNDIYTFYLESDDGSKLFIDNQMIIDNDGRHGRVEKGYSIGLNKGLHTIELQYFGNKSANMLKVSFESSDMERSSLKKTVLFY